MFSCKIGFQVMQTRGEIEWKSCQEVHLKRKRMILIGGIFAEASNIISGKEEKKISIGKEDNFNCRFRFFEKIKKINIVISNK